MKSTTALAALLLFFQSSVAALAFDHSGLSYLELAEYYAGKGESIAALRYYDKALAAAPSDSLLFQSRGFYFISLHDPERALDDFARQISLSPTEPAGYLNRGMLLGSLERDAAASAEFRRACELGSADGCLQLKR